MFPLRLMQGSLRGRRGGDSASLVSYVTRSLTTLSAAGMTAFPDRPVILLPLLESEESKAGSAPLHRLGDSHSKNRVAFRIDGHNPSSKKSIEWISSTHVFPSAYPRSHPASTSPPSDTLPALDIRRASLDKTEERKAREDDFARWDQIAKRHSMESFFPPGSEEEAREQAEKMAQGELKQPQLWTAVQRLAPKQPVKGGITLFLSHANGFHKELFEPTMQSMLSAMAQHPDQSPPIAEIWSMDNVDSGESALLNEGKLGLTVSWFDQSRDMQQFLDHYLPEPGSTTTNDVLLKRNEKGRARKARKIVGVGHSFNGAGMLMLSSLSPNCLDGVFLIDPVGVTPQDFPKLPIPADTPLSRGAIARKDVFASRNAAREYMSSRPFFQAWDPRVLDLHLRYGLRAFPPTGQENEGKKGGVVTLSQSKWREALAYSSYFLGTFSYAQVERSRFDGWAHLICMSDSDNVFFGEQGSAPLVKRFPAFAKRASSEVMPGGHLVVLEQPDQLGVRLAHVLSKYEKPARL